ncbi:alpha/beta fold hydrolase [Nioella sp.]|uniref:alpha/beta fold hydrolase n=1 Tax=Nioella sp. TaxID=1912091 RepID=UPI003A8A2B70
MPELKHCIFDKGMGTVAFSQAGHGPPLLLLHGFPEFRGIWRTVANDLADRFSLVMPDFPGVGESAAPMQPGDMRADRLGGQLGALMADLGYQRYGIVAHDVGAVAGWWLAATRPEEVSGLALVGAVAPLDYLAAVPSLDAEGRRAHVSKLLAGDPTFLSPETLFGWLADPALRSELVQALKSGSVPAMQALYQQNLTADAESFWTDLHTPAMLCRILGKEDPFLPPDLFATGHGRTICLDGGGHFLPTAHAEPLARHIAEFFDAVDKMEQTR